MKVLIAVASKHGSTREIAAAIAATLRTHSLEVDLRTAADVDDVAGYDAVIIGSAIYAGQWLPEAKRFAKQHAVQFAGQPIWLFSSGPLGTDDPQPHDDPQKLVSELPGVAIRDHHIFVGKLDPADLGFGERLIARMVHAPAGDFRDWAAVSDWASTIGAELTRSVPSGAGGQSSARCADRVVGFTPR